MPNYFCKTNFRFSSPGSPRLPGGLRRSWQASCSTIFEFQGPRNKNVSPFFPGCCVTSRRSRVFSPWWDIFLDSHASSLISCKVAWISAVSALFKSYSLFVFYKESTSRKYHTFIHKWEIQQKTYAAFRPLRGLDLVHALTHPFDFRTPGWVTIVMHISCFVDLDAVPSALAPPEVFGHQQLIFEKAPPYDYFLNTSCTHFYFPTL